VSVIDSFDLFAQENANDTDKTQSKIAIPGFMAVVLSLSYLEFFLDIPAPAFGVDTVLYIFFPG